MPNYILVSILILLSINLAFSQTENRKLYVNQNAINKIVNNKIKNLQEDVKLTNKQLITIRKIFTTEVQRIDSLKLLSPEFYEDPTRGRQIIMEIKNASEEKIDNLLSLDQKRTLNYNRQIKKKKAMEKLFQK